MDHDAFDSWTKSFKRSPGTRRGLLHSLTSGVTLAALGTLALQDASGKKRKKGKKKKKKPVTCPGNAQFCASSVTDCQHGCGCGSSIAGVGICADCALCFDPECTSDADCLARGLPPGTVCGVGTGGQCEPCSRVCLTPCGSCENCACQQV
jgi:hypothetical protein